MNYLFLDNNNNNNKLANSDMQGLEYTRKQTKIIKETEGFSNLFGENSVKTRNENDIRELLLL